MIIIIPLFFLSYLSIGDIKNTISCLIKVKQVKELTLAARLARYIDEEMEQSLIINILKIEYFKHHKWNEARELLKNHPKHVVCNRQFIFILYFQNMLIIVFICIFSI